MITTEYARSLPIQFLSFRTSSEKGLKLVPPNFVLVTIVGYRSVAVTWIQNTEVKRLAKRHAGGHGLGFCGCLRG